MKKMNIMNNFSIHKHGIKNNGIRHTVSNRHIILVTIQNEIIKINSLNIIYITIYHRLNQCWTKDLKHSNFKSVIWWKIIENRRSRNNDKILIQNKIKTISLALSISISIFSSLIFVTNHITWHDISHWPKYHFIFVLKQRYRVIHRHIVFKLYIILYRIPHTYCSLFTYNNQINISMFHYNQFLEMKFQKFPNQMP